MSYTFQRAFELHFEEATGVTIANKGRHDLVRKVDERTFYQDDHEHASVVYHAVSADGMTRRAYSLVITTIKDEDDLPEMVTQLKEFLSQFPTEPGGTVNDAHVDHNE